MNTERSKVLYRQHLLGMLLYIRQRLSFFCVLIPYGYIKLKANGRATKAMLFLFKFQHTVFAFFRLELSISSIFTGFFVTLKT